MISILVTVLSNKNPLPSGKGEAVTEEQGQRLKIEKARWNDP